MLSIPCFEKCTTVLEKPKQAIIQCMYISSIFVIYHLKQCLFSNENYRTRVIQSYLFIYTINYKLNTKRNLYTYNNFSTSSVSDCIL